MLKIKAFLESDKGKDILTVAIIILVGLGAFELGRLSKEGSPGIKIDYPADYSPEPATQAASALTGAKSFFASSRGSKYYPQGCAAGNNIKEENRVFFATAEAAESAGYELSGSCQ